MVINIDFNIKTLNKAIKQLESVENKLNTTVQKDFLKRCCNWVIKRANQNLMAVNTDKDIISGIMSSWEDFKIIKSNNTCYARVVNSTEKSVYLEFGVGIIAQQQPHPQANNENYEYNIESGKKNAQGQWVFAIRNGLPIDINVNYYDIRHFEESKQVIETKGSPANLYLYNALMSMISENAFEKLWQQSLKKVIK